MRVGIRAQRLVFRDDLPPMIRRIQGLSSCGILLSLALAIGCKGIGPPDPEQLDNVNTRLNYLREIEEIAWVDKQPPATILIGWKKYPVENFGTTNRAAAEQASRIARGVRIVSIRDFQRTMWQQVTALCESTTTGEGKFTTNCP